MWHQSIALLSLIGVFPAPAGGISESLSGALPQAPLIADLRQQKALISKCTTDNVKYVNPRYDSSPFGAYGYCINNGQVIAVNAARGVIWTQPLDKVKADRSVRALVKLTQFSEDNGKLKKYECFEKLSAPYSYECNVSSIKVLVRGVLKR